MPGLCMSLKKNVYLFYGLTLMIPTDDFLPNNKSGSHIRYYEAALNTVFITEFQNTPIYHKLSTKRINKQIKIFNCTRNGLHYIADQKYFIYIPSQG